MRVVRRPLALAAPIALAIGNFDGVHVGHQAILKATVAAARDRGVRAAVMTFEPLPREFFSRANLPRDGCAPNHTAPTTPPRLTSVYEKLSIFREAGIDDVVLVPFDAEFSALTPDEFIAFITHRLNTRWLMVGEDFRFGAKRAGDVGHFTRAKANFEAHTMPAVFVDRERASSTRVRTALASGDLALARRLLGRPYGMTGHIVHGDKRGRTLGFATANVALSRARRVQPPLWGVYAVKCALHKNSESCAPSTLYGAASLGRNPAVKQNGPPSLEVHLFDFSADIYGARMTVEFHHKLRDEATYPNLAALTAAIAADCQTARDLLTRDNISNDIS